MTIGGGGGEGIGAVGGAPRTTSVDWPAATVTVRPAAVTVALPSATETVVAPRVETVIVTVERVATTAPEVSIIQEAYFPISPVWMRIAPSPRYTSNLDFEGFSGL